MDGEQANFENNQPNESYNIWQNMVDEVSNSNPIDHQPEQGYEQQEKVNGRKIAVEFSCLDYNLQQKFRNDSQDNLRADIADGEYRHAYLSERSGQIYFGDEAETERAKDLSEESNEKYNLSFYKEERIDKGVKREINAAKEYLSNLLEFGRMHKIEGSTTEDSLDLYYQYRDRIIVDIADGFYDTAEMEPGLIENGVESDFHIKFHDRNEARIGRQQANIAKRINDQMDNPGRGESIKLAYEKLDKDVKDYIDRAKQTILGVSSFSHESIKIVEAINDEIIAGTYNNAVLNYENGGLQLDDGKESLESFYYDDFERSYYQNENSVYPERLRILKEENPAVFSRVKQTSDALKKLMESDKRFQPIYDQIQTQVARGSYEEAKTDGWFGIKIGHDISFNHKLSESRLNKVVEELTDGKVHSTGDMYKGQRPTYEDLWFDKPEIDTYNENHERLGSELYRDILEFEGSIESMIPDSDELVALKAIIAYDVFRGDTERYKGLMESVKTMSEQQTPQSIEDIDLENGGEIPEFFGFRDW